MSTYFAPTMNCLRTMNTTYHHFTNTIVGIVTFMKVHTIISNTLDIFSNTNSKINHTNIKPIHLQKFNANILLVYFEVLHDRYTHRYQNNIVITLYSWHCLMYTIIMAFFILIECTFVSNMYSLFHFLLNYPTVLHDSYTHCNQHNIVTTLYSLHGLLLFYMNLNHIANGLINDLLIYFVIAINSAVRLHDILTLIECIVLSRLHNFNHLTCLQLCIIHLMCTNMFNFSFSIRQRYEKFLDFTN